MTGISTRVQVSRLAYHAACESIHHAVQCFRAGVICSALDCRYYNFMTDHVLARHADTSNYKSADFLANSAAIIWSQRFLETSADNFLHPVPKKDSPLRGGLFLRTLPFNFLRGSNIDHRGGVRDRSLP
jgi:hypothetical protein